MTAGKLAGVMAVAGRRVDALDATERRFPEAASEMVGNEIRRLLERNSIGAVVASAACGADIVALEAAVALGRRVVIVLPFETDRFRLSSVVDRGGNWGERFDRLLSDPNIQRELIVLSPPGGSDDAAYAQATRRILAEAQRRAPADESPMAVAVWEEQVRAGMDATKDFIDRAAASGMRARSVQSLPEKAAEQYLATGKGSPEHALDVRDALVLSHPVLAHQLTRAIALRYLHDYRKELSPEELELTWNAATVERAWKACAQVEAFGLARRIVRRSIKRLPENPDPAVALKLRQKQALFTSKDPDLAAAIRHDWALKLLEPEKLPRDAEHQGIAGGIYKRRWEWDGSRASLEQSLQHYRAGIPDQPKPPEPPKLTGDGYPEINAAFVMELLASLVQDSDTAQRYQGEARLLRERLATYLPDETKNKWIQASLAEAYLGLERFSEAEQAMKNYLQCSPDPWELETTLRQLVRLGHLRKISDADLRRVLTVAIPAASPDATASGLTSLLVGKVGLALSGGGFRASLFHLGVLARLAECDVLRHVEVLSCVSGGSIVGALYYQRLKQAIETQGEELKPSDYVTIVEQVTQRFVEGVKKNVRTGLLTSFKTSLAILSGNDAAYGKAVGTAFHQTFYAQHGQKRAHMDELTVRPLEGPAHFHPGRHNWTRRNKVPSLVLNAATLNTGHSWQFTARSMGESPFTIQSAVDSNIRLRRANYAVKSKLARRVDMADAVAASACVPGLFAPLKLDQLYDGFDVRLVDGGVFDNQGISSLIEQDCQVLLVSDAAGQLFAESKSHGGHVSPLMRSIGVFQERIRQTGYEALMKRKEAGQVRDVVYTHLTQGLGIPAKDWKGCEDPLVEGDQLPETLGDQVASNVDRQLQICLAKVRTDLDVFSEIECAALMASGYLSVEGPLQPFLARLQAQKAASTSAPPTPAPRPLWFSELVPLMRADSQKAAAYQKLHQHLEAAASGVGRLVKLDEETRIVAYCVGLALVIALGSLVYVYRDAPLWTVGSVAVLALGLALAEFGGRIGRWFSNLIDVVTDPSGKVKAPFYRYAAAGVLTAVAWFVVTFLDPRYLANGELKALLYSDSKKS